MVDTQHLFVRWIAEWMALSRLMCIVDCGRNCSVNHSVPASLYTIKFFINGTWFFQGNNIIRFVRDPLSTCLQWWSLGPVKTDPQSLDLTFSVACHRHSHITKVCAEPSPFPPPSLSFALAILVAALKYQEQLLPETPLSWARLVLPRQTKQ